jgi:hypothetical protein
MTVTQSLTTWQSFGSTGRAQATAMLPASVVA